MLTVTDEPDWEAAHAALAKAIATYYETTSGEYCDAWILVSHKRSFEMEQEGTSAVGVMTAQGQSWVMSRGMIEIARESTIFSGGDDD